MEHAGTEKLPSVITADTSFWAAVINSRDPGHVLAWPLYQRLAGEGVYVVTCRHLLMPEYRNVMKRLAGGLDAKQVDRLLEHARLRQSGGQLSLFQGETCPRRDPVGKRRFLLRVGDRVLEEYMAPLRLVRVRLTTALQDAAVDVMAESALDSGDALHVAIARTAASRVGIEPHIASIDRDFLKVDGLHVWSQAD